MIRHFKQRAYVRALSNDSASLHFFPPVLLTDIHVLVDMVTSLFPKLMVAIVVNGKLFGYSLNKLICRESFVLLHLSIS